jgi:hypothetical protein
MLGGGGLLSKVFRSESTPADKHSHRQSVAKIETIYENIVKSARGSSEDDIEMNVNSYPNSADNSSELNKLPNELPVVNSDHILSNKEKNVTFSPTVIEDKPPTERTSFIDKIRYSFYGSSTKSDSGVTY